VESFKSKYMCLRVGLYAVALVKKRGVENVCTSIGLLYFINH
jgi:hypothetical protein